MKLWTILAAALVALAIASPASAAFGFNVGDQIAHRVSELVVYGPNEGQCRSLVCQHGRAPVVAIYASEINEPLINLIKRLEATLPHHNDLRLGCYVVFTNADDQQLEQIKALGKKLDLKTVILAVLPQSPLTIGAIQDDASRRVKALLPKEADMTVILYHQLRVQAQHSFGKGEFKELDIGRIMPDLTKILPDKPKPLLQ